MNKKISTELALILTLISAVVAVAFMLSLVDSFRLQRFQPPALVLHTAYRPGNAPQIKFYEEKYDFKGYGLKLKVKMTGNIIANDYSDGLIQFAIRERTAKNGEIAYDGGFPHIGVRISDNCKGQDVTLMCSHFDQLTDKPNAAWKVRKDKDEQPVSVQRVNLETFGADYFDEYYLKVRDRIVSVYYSNEASPAYVVEGVDKKTLPKLPTLAIEQKQVRDFMVFLIEQLEEK